MLLQSQSTWLSKNTKEKGQTLIIKKTKGWGLLIYIIDVTLALLNDYTPRWRIAVLPALRFFPFSFFPIITFPPWTDCLKRFVFFPSGLWNLVFLFSNLSLVFLMPFAYFFTESEGFAGSRKVPRFSNTYQIQ